MIVHVPDWLLFVVPAVAIAARIGLMIKFPLTSKNILSGEELARETSRGIILALSGFSFSALLALVVLDANEFSGLRVAIGLLLASFLAFYSSLNLQSYKVRRWEDQVATGLKEAASGWLLLSVVAVVNGSGAGETFALVVAFAALAVWSVDLLIRMVLDYRYLRDTEAN